MTFWHDIEKEKGKRNTELYLRRAKTLKAAGIRVKGHPLILPGVCPGWVPKDADGGRDAVKDWITHMVRTFRGVVDIWDVTGDIWTADNQQNGIGAWVRKAGRQQVFSDALRWTLAANPNAVTLYNDFALDNAFVDLVRGALRGGDPLHVQGLEAHMDGAGWLLEQLWVHSDTFGKLGRPLHWSEITPSDIVMADGEGNIVEGKYPVEPTAFYIHARIHAGGQAGQLRQPQEGDGADQHRLGHEAAVLHLALDALARGLGKLSANPERLAADLDAAWEVLAEPVQTVMRRHGLPNPYEQLKALTRGHGITEASMREFINGLDLPADAKARLLAMTPGTYTGHAAALARDI